MKFIRNPEIQKTMILFLSCTTLGMTLSGLTAGRAAVGVMLLISCLFAFLYFIPTWRRYQKLELMSQQLDLILHDTNAELFGECQEGEMAVLQSQIVKMVIRLREQAETLQKDKVFLGDSLADISHQIKTPLTSIHLLINFLMEEDLSQERRQKIARELTCLVERIDWLIYALLKLSSLDAGIAVMHSDMVTLKELVNKAYELVAVPMDIRGIGWECQIDADASFLGDMSWSVEAVSNILKNCMEHTESDGKIIVRGIENVLFTELIIQDTGSGIAPEDLSHLFERFYKGKNAGSNSVGIGLSLAHRIIVEQNGTIQVRNRPEQGAEFRIRFYHKLNPRT